MTDLEKAREALVRRGHPLGGVTVWENLIRAVFAEMRAAEVPEPQSVAEPVKRMMRARGYDGMSYATTINTLAHHYDTEHEESEWCRKLGCKPFVEAEPETPAPDSYTVSFNKGWVCRDEKCKSGECAGYLRGVEEMTEKYGIIVREERAKKRTVSAEARKKIGLLLWSDSYSTVRNDLLLDAVLEIVEADDAEPTRT